jgi:hypothetical protein
MCGIFVAKLDIFGVDLEQYSIVMLGDLNI